VNKKLAEMQSAFGEQIGSLRAAMDSKLQALEKAAADDAAKLQQFATEASLIRAQLRQVQDLLIQFPKSFFTPVNSSRLA